MATTKNKTCEVGAGWVQLNTVDTAFIVQNISKVSAEYCYATATPSETIQGGLLKPEGGVTSGMLQGLVFGRASGDVAVKFVVFD